MISLSVLRHVEASTEERVAYLKQANAQRGAGNGDAEAEPPADGEEPRASADVTLSPERFAGTGSSRGECC